MMHVLVTGGAGYIGSVLCERLLDAGHRITVIDSLVYGQTGLYHLCSNPRFDFVKADARDEGTLRKLLGKADAIIPLAAIVGPGACQRDPVTATTVNHDAIQLINRLRSRNQLVLFPSTISGYGSKPAGIICTEDTPQEPISLYGRTKVLAEQELLQSPNVVALRLSTVFGMSPRMRIDLLVNYYVYSAATEGHIVIYEKNFRRSHVHTLDVSDCFLFSMENAIRLEGKPYNVSSQQLCLSKEELAFEVKKHIPGVNIYFDDSTRDPDKRNYDISGKRLQDAGFFLKRTIQDGIKELQKGYSMLPTGRFKNN